jgi:hypothetical protein
MESLVRALADTLVLGALLEEVRSRFQKYELLEHWKQGEFHHDVVVRISGAEQIVLVVATNCNGGVKEVLAFDTVPDRWALWHWRCPQVNDFAGDLPPLRARATTTHWFDPCALLVPDARSELREEFRQRQPGGGWEMSSSKGCGRPDS